MKKSFLYATLILTLAPFFLRSQELPRNLVYGNERLLFEDVLHIGEYKMLRFTHQRRQNERFVYLLDKANIPTDTMKVLGNDFFLIRSDSTFSIRGLGEYVDVEIINGKFKTTSAFETYADFRDAAIDLDFRIGNFMVGSLYNEQQDCSNYHYIKSDELLGVKTANKASNSTYGFNEVDTLLVFSNKYYERVSNEKYDLNLLPLLPTGHTCKRALSYPYFSFNRYAIDQDSYYFYEKTGNAFKFKVSDNQITLEKSITLPVDKKDVGWKYLFDNKSKKHYFAKRIGKVDDSISRRRKRKKEKTYTYEIYQMDWQAEALKPLYKLPFEPVAVHSDLIYEIVKESKKGSALYFHPLDPNYKYEKSTLIYSSNN